MSNTARRQSVNRYCNIDNSRHNDALRRELTKSTLLIRPSSITELLMLLYSSNSASTSLTLTVETKNGRSN